MGLLKDRIYKSSYRDKMTREWFDFLYEFLTDTRMSKTYEFLRERRKLIGNQWVFPKDEYLFNAFNFCDPEDIKVVILGTDPYPKAYLNTGLAYDFPIQEETPLEAQEFIKEYVRTRWKLDEMNKKKYKELWSIETQLDTMTRELDELMTDEDNIELAEREVISYQEQYDQELEHIGVRRYKEIINQVDTAFSGWASQGVLMLNASMTTDMGDKREEHYEQWEWFLKNLLSKLSTQGGIYFYFFDKHAQMQRILEGVQESDNIVEVDVGMEKSDFFVNANTWLAHALGYKQIIDWSLGLEFLKNK